MEPRPPRPRPTDPNARAGRGPDGSGRPTTVYPGGQPDAAPYAPTGYGGAPPVATEIPLLPRQQRRRRRLVQTALAGLLVFGGIGGAATYFLQDRLTDDPDPTPQTIAAASPPASTTAPPADTTEPPAAAEPTAPAPGGVAARATATATAPPAAPTEAAAAATEPPVRAARPTRRTAEAAPDPGDTDGPVPVEELLPATVDRPPDAAEPTDLTRTLEEVATNLGTEDATTRLTELGWQANVVRNFESADPSGLPPGSTSAISVSIHRFNSAASAAEALPYFSDQLVSGSGYDEFELGELGETRRGLVGVNSQGVADAVAYVQVGPDLYRIGGTATTEEGDPTGDVIAAAEQIVAG